MRFFVTFFALAFANPVFAQTVEVPNFVGSSLSSAENTISDLGLIFDGRPIQSSEPKNSILSQVPVATSIVPSGSRVVMEYSDGLPLRSFEGEARQSAVDALIAAGFTIEVTQASECPYESSSAQVIRQFPEGGGNIDASDTVVFLEVGTPKLHSVPNVVGKSLGAARQTVLAAGLNLSHVSDSRNNPFRNASLCQHQSTKETVTSMKTAAGTVLCRGTTVTVGIHTEVTSVSDCRACATCAQP